MVFLTHSRNELQSIDIWQFDVKEDDVNVFDVFAAGQMVDDRLPVHFKERYLTALFIFQPQIAEEVHFSLIRQDIHQGQLHIRSYYLIINLGYHQRVLSRIRQSRKILCVNDPQPVNRVDFQINISQIQKTHSRFNGKRDIVPFCLFPQQCHRPLRYQRAAGYRVDHFFILGLFYNERGDFIIHFFKSCFLFIPGITGNERDAPAFQFRHSRVNLCP